MSPADSSVRMPSRTAMRLTANCSASSRSVGRRAPGGSAPAAICWRICALISSEIRRVVIGLNASDGVPAGVGADVDAARVDVARLATGRCVPAAPDALRLAGERGAASLAPVLSSVLSLLAAAVARRVLRNVFVRLTGLVRS